MESMQLQNKLREDKLDLLLQRYRSDGYALAKQQRNKLASLKADRREVIKAGS